MLVVPEFSRFSLVAVAVFALVACSDSGSESDAGSDGSPSLANAFGLFGSRDPQPDANGSQPSAAAGSRPVQDERLLAGQITNVRLDRTPSGFILLATVQVPQAGFHSVELVADTRATASEDAMLTYLVYGSPPARPDSSASPVDIQVATFIPKRRLDGYSGVRVAGRNNAVEVQPG